MFNALFLTFSDSAKYAEVARNIVSGRGFTSWFSFFGGPPIILPAFPYSIAFFYKLFGVNDFAVIITSVVYFILTLAFVLLLTKKLTNNNLIAWLSLIAVGFNYDLINYATGGASESLFILEIVASTYFVTLKKKRENVIALLILILMYFTRPQAFIYIAGIIFYYFLLNVKSKKAFIYFAIISCTWLLIDKLVLPKFGGHYFIYSILGRGNSVLSNVGTGQSASDQLRSAVTSNGFSILELVKKVFYNLYNFYKLLPQIINPYVFILFIIGLFKAGNKEFKLASAFMVLATFLVTAASIPFFRYIHPIIPLVYIIAVTTLSNIVVNKKLLLFLVAVFVVGQTLGIIFLDSRFEKTIHNVGKPPVYFVLSRILNEHTDPNSIIVTNLDTWGSWYGGRKTIWYPIEPGQLVDKNIKAIYLTDYLIDDPNYYMGENWRSIFENPKNQTILKDFKYYETYTVSANDDYERRDAKAILLIRK